MSTTTETNSAVTAYLDAVRLYLSDLPEWDAEDLMADIEQHVVEVASEWDGPITSILGDPISFVDEYRQSAHVPPVVDEPATPPLIDRIVGTVDSMRKGQLWLSIRAFAQEARPGWWALRGYMAASVVMVVISSTSRSTMVDPFVFGIRGLVVSVVGIVLSVHLGRRSQARTWRRWVAIATNVCVLAMLVISGQDVNNLSMMMSDSIVQSVVSNEQQAYEAGLADGQAIAVAPEVEFAAETIDVPFLELQSRLEAAIDAFDSCIAAAGADVTATLVPEVGVDIDGSTSGLDAMGMVEECVRATDLRLAEAEYVAVVAQPAVGIEG